MQYLAMIYGPRAGGRRSPRTSAARSTPATPRSPTSPGGRECSSTAASSPRRRPPPPSAFATARRSSPTARSSSRRRRSAATSCSSASRSRRRSTGPRGSPAPRRRDRGPALLRRRVRGGRGMKYALLLDEQPGRSRALGARWPRTSRRPPAPPRCRSGTRSSASWGEREAPLRQRARRSGDLEDRAVRDGERVVTDGPFAETKEQIGGLMVIEADDLDEAISIAARVPVARARLGGDPPARSVDRARLPRGMGPCRLHPHPRPRRSLTRRGRGAGCLHDRPRALAARRRPRETPEPGSSRPPGTARSTGSGASRSSRARPSCWRDWSRCPPRRTT